MCSLQEKSPELAEKRQKEVFLRVKLTLIPMNTGASSYQKYSYAHLELQRYSLDKQRAKALLADYLIACQATPERASVSRLVGAYVLGLTLFVNAVSCIDIDHQHCDDVVLNAGYGAPVAIHHIRPVGSKGAAKCMAHAAGVLSAFNARKHLQGGALDLFV